MQTMKFTLIRAAMYTCTYLKERQRKIRALYDGILKFPRGGNQGTFKSAKSKLQLGRSRSYLVLARRLVIVVETTREIRREITKSISAGLETERRFVR